MTKMAAILAALEWDAEERLQVSAARATARGLPVDPKAMYRSWAAMREQDARHRKPMKS